MKAADNKAREIVRTALQGCAWPGGYPLYLVTGDGGALCPQCVKRELRVIIGTVRDEDTQGGWYPAGVDVNWEDPALYCDHCGERIESAYGED